MTDIEAMKKSQDIRGLIRLLDYGNTNMEWRAADALGTMGEKACDPLVKLLAYPKANVRIGAIEALGAIKSPRGVEALIQTLSVDKSNEVRWVAALALGEIGDARAIPPLLLALRDDDRYIRYGSIKSLEKLHWEPEDLTARAYALIALQDWHSIRKLGLVSVGPLIEMMKDKNPITRSKIIELLGEIRGPEAKEACESALRDGDAAVRWNAVLAAKKCGVTATRFPLILARRPLTIPSPLGAAILNLFFFGLGYQYIGKWWGFLVFMCYMTVIVLAQLNIGFFLPFMIAYPITAVFAVQTYYMVKRMPDM